MRRRKRGFMDSPLRLIATNPLDKLARTLEALLVVASAPLTVQELADAADDDAERVEAALGLVGERYREGRSGIVLEHVAGGWAFRASRDAAEACSRRTRRRSLSRTWRCASRPCRNSSSGSARCSAAGRGSTSTRRWGS